MRRFYTGKMGGEPSVIEAANGTILTGGASDHNKKVVTITSDEGETKIAIVHTTNLH